MFKTAAQIGLMVVAALLLAGSLTSGFAQDNAAGTADSVVGWSQLSSSDQARAISYSSTRNVIYFGSEAFSFVILIIILFSGFSGYLMSWTRSAIRWRWLSFTAYVGIMLAILSLINLPIDYYAGFHLEHQYGLSNQTFGAWFGDWAKGLALTLVFGTLLIAGAYAIIRKRPKTWWAWMALAAVPVLLLIIVLAPIIVTPLFYDMSPLNDGQLKAQILDLASQSGIPDSRVMVMDASKNTAKLNAYVTGLGQTKRIVLYDNLVANMTPDEVLFVVGHEMGHYLLHHMWIGLGIAVLLVFVLSFLSHQFMGRLIARNTKRWGFSSLGEIASLPLLLLSLGLLGFLVSPIQNGIWRHFEHEADVFGLEQTRMPNAAVGSFDKLAAVNLSNPNPSPFIKFWRYDHPTLAERVQFAQAYESVDESANPLRNLGERHFGQVTQLTNGGENAEAYFNAAGDKLIFQSTRGDYGCDRIFTMNIDGSDVQQVSVPGGVTTCSFVSPNADQIIYCSTYLVDDSCPPKPSYEHGYVWKLFNGYDVFSADPDGSNVVRLTDTPRYDAEAVFSPDGRTILFTSLRDGDLELYTMNADGSDQTRLTHELGYDGGGFFSPDGKRIVYRAHHPVTDSAIADYKALLDMDLIRPSTLEIFVMDVDGSNRRQITDNGAANFCPYFHPNGRQIIFSSNMDDPKGRNFELYLINIDGTGLERVTYNESFDGFPMFNHDGTKLVWASNRHNQNPFETNVFITDWIDEQ